MKMSNRALAGALLSLGALGLACTAQAAGFKPCLDAASDAALAGSVCAVEAVPADPSGAAGQGGDAGSVSLFVRSFPAVGKPRGRIWLIAGGPGESGANFYTLVPALRAALPGFDLVIPDHRGTGFSTRMCPAEEAAGSAAGAALAGAEWNSCFAQLNADPARTRRFSQTNAAHDLKHLLERRRGKGKTYVYGVSYGTQLVLRTLALGARDIDGVILDSLVSLQDDDKADLSRRSLVADAVGRQRLADCDADPRCSARLGEPAEQVYRRALLRAAQEPQLLAAVPGGNLKQFLGTILDLPSAARELPTLIKDIDAGKPDWAKAVLAGAERDMASLGSFPQSPSSIPLVMLISASENTLRPGRSAAQVAEEEAGLLFASSLPGYLVGSPIPTYGRDALFARLPERLPPTLVLHGDRDAKTPYDAALRHIAALRKAGPVRLYTAKRTGHYVLWADRACAHAEVRRFVLGQPGGAGCVQAASSR
ncbi:alpha/beta hydrolase [Massilia sp. GCM10023247]|uniref:alpha/beta hydrolase n=1 Tax=Massilia sp. GCM10023247 TaxID=3252643 RepID=UPI00361176BE